MNTNISGGNVRGSHSWGQKPEQKPIQTAPQKSAEKPPETSHTEVPLTANALHAMCPEITKAPVKADLGAEDHSSTASTTSDSTYPTQPQTRVYTLFDRRTPSKTLAGHMSQKQPRRCLMISPTR